MRELKKKFLIVISSLIGEMIKFYNKTPIAFKSIRGVNMSEKRSEKVVVSLTSYGKRVTRTLPYTIISLLKQSYKPDVVVLWLDRDEWNECSIPNVLKQLRGKGLTIRFCENLYSFKKHIPTLEAYPDDIIITVDDDFYYPSNFIKKLMIEYERNPGRIYTHLAHRPTFSDNGDLMPYSSWDKLVSDSCESPLFATTGGGCLYKKSFLYKDVCNRNLFQILCPKADDVWMYFMGVLNGTPTMVLKNNHFSMIPLDVFYQLTHKDSNLSAVNVKKSYNDVQIEQVMEYYHLKPSDLVLERLG